MTAMLTEKKLQANTDLKITKWKNAGTYLIKTIKI